ncbi:uncharacterized protein [Coffea arabica]|uniref:Uncharacterized protein n=1 Tax=Coffea arabica TaxID=13443 RepID=A0A6P6WTX4_COFAR
MAKLLQDLVYQEESPSIYTTALSGITLLFLAYLGISETLGNHLKYSKFWNVNSQKSGGGIKLPSRTGMLLLYSPAAVAGLASFMIFPGGGIRFLMLKLAITIHFSKRVLNYDF